MKTLTARSLVVGGWIVAGLAMPFSAFADTPLFHAKNITWSKGNHAISGKGNIATSSKGNIASALQSETAQVDNSPAPTSQAESTPPRPVSTPLQGGVSKLQELLKESTELYKLAVDKLNKGIKLSAEEYRSLGVGCVGMETDRTFFQDIAVISDVYLDSPAAKAGLHKGDRLLDNSQNDDAAKEHPEIPRWKVTFGQAGTQSQYILLRHHKQVPITLTRMNIEDIADDKIRQEWEQIISKLGNPAQGEFEGVGTNPLSYKANGTDPDDSE